MGSCMSNQNELALKNGKTLDNRTRSLLETYPAPTKYRLGSSIRPSNGSHTAAMVHHWESKIRPPAVHSTPSRIPRPGDSNGNTRPEPLPLTQLPRKHGPTGLAAPKVKPPSPASMSSSVSSLSTSSMTTSRSSSRSTNSIEDSGIGHTPATSSLTARKSALSLKLNVTTKPQSKLPKPAAPQTSSAATQMVQQTPKRLPEPRNKLDAIAASLEEEVLAKISAEKPKEPVKKVVPEERVVLPAVSATTCEVESFVLYPGHPELTYVETPSSVPEELIEDISPLPTPASLCSSVNSPQETGKESTDQACSSTSHNRPADDDESPTNSLSDALIDDEIADQPGLLMLNQSDSAAGSPVPGWSPEPLFNGTTVSQATLSLISCHSFDDDDDQGVLRRRVASVTDVSGEETSAAAVNMRVELFSQSRDCVVSTEEYNAMVNDLAEIKKTLLQLQHALQEDSPADFTQGDGVSEEGDQGSVDCASRVWDMKRELVLMREELKEKTQTIRHLKQELRSVKTRSGEISPALSKSLTNVATQTDRLKSSLLCNGLSPSKETVDANLVSSKTAATRIPALASVRVRPATPAASPAAARK